MRIREKRGDRSHYQNEVAQVRAAKVSSALLGSYLDNAAVNLGQAVDAWRFHSAPAIEVERSIEGILALWDEVRRRDMV